MVQVTPYVYQIQRGARSSGQRTGQYLFNRLPNGAAATVTGTLFDPFNKELNAFEIQEWIDDHLIFSSIGKLIAVFNGEKILWENED